MWWRRLHDTSEEQLDNTHLMRLAGRFSRRVRGFARAQGISVIDCGPGERKHQIAEDYLATHSVGPRVFLILVARAAATVWEVKRSASGVIGNLEKKTAHVNHYSFHIMDPDWGHLTIKMSGHPPFGAQAIANGHEWVALKAQTAGIGFTKEGNCFTAAADPQALAQVAAALSQHATRGRLRRVWDRWISSACLCFGLSLEQQQRSGFGYEYSVYQVEYRRNLLFRSGAQTDRVVTTLVDRTRGRLDVPMLRTLFGAKQRPRRGGTRDLSPRLAIVIETPRWDLTWFKVHFGLLSLKADTKGDHVLRVEATVHNTKQLGCGRAIEQFPQIVSRLAGMTERFCTTLDCVTTGSLPDGTLDQLPLPSRIGRTRIGGIDLNKPRMRAALAAVLTLAAAPAGFTVADLAAKVQAMAGPTQTGYTTRQAAYDLRKLRGKDLLVKPGRSRRYQVPPPAARTIAGLLTLRDQVIGPILAGVRSPRLGRKPAHWTAVDRDYETLRIGMQALFADLGITTSSAAA